MTSCTCVWSSAIGRQVMIPRCVETSRTDTAPLVFWRAGYASLGRV